ncbi:MAG: hypothetical protein AB4057_15175 [Crocosphaera sp.]
MLNKISNLVKSFRKTMSQKEKPNSTHRTSQNYRSDILLVFTLFVLTITLYFCWGIIINPDSNADNVKSAFSLIVAIVSGLLGFVTGKSIS